MEYFSERTAPLKDEAEKLDFSDKQKEFVDKLITLITDMAVIIDDAVDAIDEVDMRLLELEQQHEEK